MQDNIQYKNECLKRKFFSHLRELKGFSPDTLEAYEGALLLWQNTFPNELISTFTQKRARYFKDMLKQKKKPSGDLLSLNYCYTLLRHLRTFFNWLSFQPGYRTKIVVTDIDYLRLSNKENKIALQQKTKTSPTIEEMREVLENFVIDSEIDKRDRALISLMFLTGARISATYTLPLGSLDTKRLLLDQDPTRGVKTKNSKHIQTVFFPLCYREPIKYVLEWVNYLIKDKGFTSTDPLFPTTQKEGTVKVGTRDYGGHITKEFWKSSEAIRRIFKKRFEASGVPYYHPHSLRDTIVKEIIKKKLTEEEKKALSQNLGHENVGTTFGSYGHGRISENNQFEIINKINLDHSEEEKPLDAEGIRKIIQEELRSTK